MSSDSQAVGVTIVAGATTVGAATTLASTGSPVVYSVVAGVVLLVIAGILVKKSQTK